MPSASRPRACSSSTVDPWLGSVVPTLRSTSFFRARALLQQQRAQPFAHRAGAELILRGHYALYAVQRPANTVAVQRRDPVQFFTTRAETPSPASSAAARSACCVRIP